MDSFLEFISNSFTELALLIVSFANLAITLFVNRNSFRISELERKMKAGEQSDDESFI